MTTIDFTPLYRNTIGFERLASRLEGAFRAEQSNTSYPPYNIEAIDEDRYTITLAVAGFSQEELDVHVERGILTVKGRKAEDKTKGNFLYQGIATRAFVRKFNLADHVEITSAKLDNGLLVINLKRELPEAMKPRRIEINGETVNSQTLQHQSETEQAA